MNAILADYVIERCRREPDTGCLVWAGAVNNCGRPVFRLACCGTRDPRRILWEAQGRPFDPRHVFVEPQCADGHRCIEPSHQSRMTRRQAARRPGVMSSGARHSAAIVEACRRRPHVRLTLETARAIRARYIETGNAAQVAREFGIGHAHAHRIATNQSWREPSPWAI
jgi:hypothetical protein